MAHLFVVLQAFVAHRRALMDDRGATAVEYALMVGLIAVGIIVSVVALKTKVAKTFNTVAGTIG